MEIVPCFYTRELLLCDSRLFSGKISMSKEELTEARLGNVGGRRKMSHRCWKDSVFSAGDHLPK